MTYYPTEPDAEDARHLLDTALLADDEQLALEQILSAFEADDACDDEAADILNNLRETEMPPAAALAQARSLPVGKAIEMRSASAVFVVRNDKGGVQWQREHRK